MPSLLLVQCNSRYVSGQCHVPGSLHGAGCRGHHAVKLCNFGIASSCQQHPIDGAHHCKDIQLSAENFTESIAAASEMSRTLTPLKHTISPPLRLHIVIHVCAFVHMDCLCRACCSASLNISPDQSITDLRSVSPLEVQHHSMLYSVQGS